MFDYFIDISVWLMSLLVGLLLLGYCLCAVIIGWFIGDYFVVVCVMVLIGYVLLWGSWFYALTGGCFLMVLLGFVDYFYALFGYVVGAFVCLNLVCFIYSYWCLLVLSWFWFFLSFLVLWLLDDDVGGYCVWSVMFVAVFWCLIRYDCMSSIVNLLFIVCICLF